VDDGGTVAAGRDAGHRPGNQRKHLRHGQRRIWRDSRRDTNPAAETTFGDGKSNNLSLTYGSPLLIPGLFNGQNKLFMKSNF
jgi:hypothetical protein